MIYCFFLKNNVPRAQSTSLSANWIIAFYRRENIELARQLPYSYDYSESGESSEYVAISETNYVK